MTLSVIHAGFELTEPLVKIHRLSPEGLEELIEELSKCKNHSKIKYKPVLRNYSFVIDTHM